MIKIKDLIIGDLVFVGTDDKRKLARVTGLLNTDDGENLPDTIELMYQKSGLRTSVSEDDCYPVKMDMEVILYLGMTRFTDKCEFLGVEDDSIRLAYNPDANEMTIYPVKDSDKLVSLRDIEYVHQIQHQLLGFGETEITRKIENMCFDGTEFYSNKRRMKLFNRYNNEVYLEETDEENKYLFVAKYDYMQLSYDNEGTYYSIDPDGGPYISIGGSIPVMIETEDENNVKHREYENIEILKIEQINKKYYITTKENLFK